MEAMVVWYQYHLEQDMALVVPIPGKYPYMAFVETNLEPEIE